MHRCSRFSRRPSRTVASGSAGLRFPYSVGTIEKLYAAGGQAAVDGIVGTTVDPSVVAANPTMMVVISALALVVNVVALGYIICVSKKRHINQYKQDVFVNQKYYKDAMARADVD